MTQEEALSILKTGANVFLTGEPGSGKTFTVNSYVAYLQSCGIEPAITASTGIAATHIGGMTIHSWCGIGITSRVSDYDLEFISQKEKVVRRVTSAKVLIIDEISMLSADTLSSVELVCRHLRGNEQPFGGLQVVLVGDFFQLPPVEKRTAPVSFDGTIGKAGAQFAFRSAAWTRAQFLVCYLSEQHRQEDATFISTLGAIRRGDIGDEIHEVLSERHVTEIRSGITQLFPHNADVDRINDSELSKLDTNTKVFHMQSRGGPALIEGLKRSCLSPETLTLKVGAKVMFTKNDPEGAYVNGTTGEVVGFSSISTYPLVTTRSGKTFEVQPVEWAIQDGQKILAKITQLPLRLAWAITVHKSQGMSLDAAVMDLSSAFEYGQGYVALSRVRTLEGLYLLGINQRALEVHPEVSTQDELFRAQSERAEELFAEMGEGKVSAMHANFMKAAGGSIGGGAKKEAAKVPGSTYVATQELLQKKLSLEEIAQERNLTLGTIISHLEKLVAQGAIDPARDLAYLSFEDDRFEKITKALRAVHKKEGSMPLVPVMRQLDDSYTFEEIRLARLFI